MKTKRFNPIEMLHSDQEIAEFLAEAYNNDDPAEFVAALGFLVEHKGVAEISDATGLNRESLYKVVRGDVQPKWDTVHRLMRAGGVKLTVDAA